MSGSNFELAQMLVGAAYGVLGDAVRRLPEEGATLERAEISRLMQSVSELSETLARRHGRAVTLDADRMVHMVAVATELAEATPCPIPATHNSLCHFQRCRV
jgi:hypothetical protein